MTNTLEEEPLRVYSSFSYSLGTDNGFLVRFRRQNKTFLIDLKRADLRGLPLCTYVQEAVNHLSDSLCLGTPSKTSRDTNYLGIWECSLFPDEVGAHEVLEAFKQLLESSSFMQNYLLYRDLSRRELIRL